MVSLTRDIIGSLAPRLRAAVPALALAAAFGSGACGDGLEQVELGDIRCTTSPCAVDFGQLNLNRPGQTAKIEITNVGQGDLALSSITLEGAGTGFRFSDVTIQDIGNRTNYEWRNDATAQAFETGGTELVLGPDQRLEIELEFRPQGGEHGCPGPSQGSILGCGTVVIVSDDVDLDEATLEVDIIASVGDSRMEVDPLVVAFSPPQLIDAGSNQYATQEREFTIANLGTGNMVLQNIEANNVELSVEDASGQSYPITMVGGAERDFVITWEPTSDEPLQAQITVTSNAVEGAVQTIIVNSTGGDSAVIGIEPCDFVFDDAIVGEASEILFDVENSGTAGMTWSVSVSSVRPTSARADFTIQTANGEPSAGQQDTLAPENTRAMKLVYTPSSAESVTGELSFRGNFGNAVSCPISAGEPVPVAEVLPGQLYWGGIAQGATESRSFVVTNSGRADLVVSSIDESGDLADEFTVDPVAAAGFTLAPNASRRVEVEFARRAEDVPAQDTATLVVNHNGTGGSSQVFLVATHGDEFLPPTCALSASPEEPYSVGTTVTFDATGSELNAGEWATNQFQWGLVAPAGSTSSLSSGAGDAVSVTFDTPGTYELNLIATAVVSGERLSCELNRNVTVGE